MDRHSLVEIFAELKDKAKALELSEDELLRQLEVIRGSQKALRSQLNNVTNQLAPVSSLPFELLSRILVDVGKEYADMFPILLLSHVNRHWRDVAIATATLWTNINFSSDKSLGLLDLFLERSREHLLDIRLDDSAHTPSILFCRVLDRIVPLISRWRLFTVNSWCGSNLEEVIIRISLLAAPRLRFFRLDLDPTWDTPEWINHYSPTRILAGGAPALESVHLYNVHVLSCMPPLGTILKLTLVAMDARQTLNAGQFYDVLVEAPALVDLELYGELLDPYENIEPIDIPSLRSLLLDPLDENSVLNVLNNISMPGLETLHLLSLTNSQVSSIVEFICAGQNPPPYPALRSLSLHWFEPCGSCLHVGFIRALPTITSFEVCSDYFTENDTSTILKLLVDDAENQPSPLWPLLDTIALTFADVDLLCTFISFRAAIGCPIRSLTVSRGFGDCDFEVPRDRVDWLQEHVSNVNLCT